MAPGDEGAEKQRGTVLPASEDSATQGEIFPEYEAISLPNGK